jgi:hypothetical protein
VILLNYFNYFTEIEEQFQRRRGSLLMLSTLDWALIDTWREAGIPLAAVLRGIDAAFEKRAAHPGRRAQKPVNGLAWCAQAVVEEAQSMQEAAVGASRATTPAQDKEDGFSSQRIRTHLERCAAVYESQDIPEFADAAQRLRQLTRELEAPAFRMEDLERALTMLEEKIFAALLTRTPDEELVRIRAQSSSELAPYRRKLQSAQIAQIERQFLNKRLLESRKLPRLSLFYIEQV